MGSNRLSLHRATDDLMYRKVEDYTAPLQHEDFHLSIILRVGSPRELIVQIARNLNPHLLVWARTANSVYSILHWAVQRNRSVGKPRVRSCWCHHHHKIKWLKFLKETRG